MRALASLLSAALLGLFVWQAVVWIFGFRAFILPGPVPTAEALWTFRWLIAENTLYTLTEIALGLALGAGLGIATAINLAASPFARAHIRPILVFLQAVPVFALAPILMIWFGFGIWPKVVVVVLITYFPITSAFFDGLLNTPPGYLDLGIQFAENLHGLDKE